jgi:hypothetical protein
MEYLLDSAGQRWLRRYLDRIGAILNTLPQRRAFAVGRGRPRDWGMFGAQALQLAQNANPSWY